MTAAHAWLPPDLQLRRPVALAPVDELDRDLAVVHVEPPEPGRAVLGCRCGAVLDAAGMCRLPLRAIRRTSLQRVTGVDAIVCIGCAVRAVGWPIVAGLGMNRPSRGRAEEAIRAFVVHDWSAGMDALCGAVSAGHISTTVLLRSCADTYLAAQATGPGEVAPTWADLHGRTIAGDDVSPADRWAARLIIARQDECDAWLSLVGGLKFADVGLVLARAAAAVEVCVAAVRARLLPPDPDPAGAGGPAGVVLTGQHR